MLQLMLVRLHCALFSPVIWTLFVSGLIVSGVAAEEKSPPIRDLIPGKVIEGTISANAVHRYQLSVPIGDTSLITIDQIGIDLRGSLTSPQGTSIATVDIQTFNYGPEWLAFRSQSVDSYRVEVSAKAGQDSGRYRIRSTPLPQETNRDRQWLAAALAMSQGGEYSAQQTSESRHLAIDEYHKALNLWIELQERYFQATALHSIAQLSRQLGNIAQAREYLERVLPLWRSLREQTREAAVLAELGLAHLELGETALGRHFLERSSTLSRAQGDTVAEARTRGNLCMAELANGRVREALPCYEEVLNLHRQSGKALQEARVLLNLGWIHGTLGQPHLALDRLQLGLDILHKLGDRLGEAQALNNIGYTYEHLGETQTALEQYNRSLTILRQLGDRWWTARLLNNIGYIYWGLRDHERARSFFQEALPLRREVQDRRGEAITLMNLGGLDLEEDRVQAALEAFEQSLVLTRETSYRQKEGVALGLMAQAHAALGHFRDAESFFAQALSVHREAGAREAEGNVLLHLGRLRLDAGAPEKALDAIEQALQIHRSIQFRQGEAQVLYESARVYHQLGRDSKALDRLEASLQVIETLRTQVASPGLRASFSSASRDAYELQIELLMSRHRQQPEAGFADQAFLSSERARARTLLDLLNESEAEIYAHVDPALKKDRRRLKQRLNAKAAYQQAVLEREHTEEEVRTARHQFHETLAELEALEASIRRDHPQINEVTAPTFASVPQVQQVLGPQTLLLQYALGKERSYLWIVSHQAASVFELPSRVEIETQARQAYEELSGHEIGRAPGYSDDLKALARQLLGPLIGRLRDQRLVIVADGALHYLPFAALPHPETMAPEASSNPQPLISRHEVVHLPSTSALVAQRRRFADRAKAKGTLAVLADPVFQLADARLGGSFQGAPVREPAATGRERSVRSSAPLERLPATRIEAESIIQPLPRDAVFLALGFDANKSTFLAGQLDQYRIVHLATHGVIDAHRPELSGIVLSQLDADGRKQDGFVRLHDLYDLQLNADLVVLSGCQTALGSEMRGEGLVGLTRGFMYSGARRVIASLWRVQDKVTAEFMTHFYRAMLVDDRSPAAALRLAQEAIRSQKHWRAPYFWGAFVLQGDWQ